MELRSAKIDAGGKIRWVVERAITWLKGLRRLRMRLDRLGVIMDAWTTLAANVICFRIRHHDVRQESRLSRPEIIGVVNQLEGGATEFIQWT